MVLVVSCFEMCSIHLSKALTPPNFYELNPFISLSLTTFKIVLIDNYILPRINLFRSWNALIRFQGLVPTRTSTRSPKQCSSALCPASSPRSWASSSNCTRSKSNRETTYEGRPGIVRILQSNFTFIVNRIEFLYFQEWKYQQ